MRQPSVGEVTTPASFPAHLTPETFADSAFALADTILNAASRRDDGSLTWDRGFNRKFESVVDASPFNGRIGEALLFAALAHHEGGGRHEQLPLQIAAPVQKMISTKSGLTYLVDELDIGLVGVGGILYALAKLTEFTGDRGFDSAARSAVSMLSDAVVDDDRHWDVYWGTPGLILGLLAVAKSGCEEAMALAASCADRLVKRRVVDDLSGFRAWATLEGLPAAGFAHGNSGIAYSLLSLYQQVSVDAYYDAALEAFAFERSLYRFDIGEWPDIRDQRYLVMTSWCHGAPGIGMARLGALPVLRATDESAIAADLQHALRRTAGFTVHGVQSLCCGTFGRVDCLLEAGRQLGNGELVYSAYRLAGWCRSHADTIGYHVARSATPYNEGGLWQGLSGIAYQLLRLGAPHIYPSILMMQ